ncbi:amine oxidase [Pedobacter mucosus]|uniref:amine oxidase n=1 Tax=Pedobacter mucosus TaxID=2895286 RepID=UPI001EE4DB26|nr:amine oxidase [Pedobacter mucosus]UKT63960.1 amine oxidase [Pedobacter mucosus]
MIEKNQSPFRSFWMAGFECSDQLNHYGNRVDLSEITGHLTNAATDYNLIKSIGILTVREGIRWSKIETQPFVFDFTSVAKMIDAAKENGIQQIWDICHFGYPDDLSPLHPHFESRFVAVCSAFANFFKSYCPNEQLIVTPVNEVGFISWLGGDHASTTPYARGMGWDVKYSLIRAYIQGIKAMKAIDASVKILTTEPLVNIVPPLNANPEMVRKAAEDHEIQYQAVDMLTGKICPELGGSDDLIDYLGFNFYYNNQWISNEFTFLPWANLEPDPRFRGLSSLFLEAYQRYNKPILLTETSHSGEHRPNWIELITKECIKAFDLGVQLEGVCLYPIIDRPDWDHLHVWHHSGLWDADADHPHDRNLYSPYADAIVLAMQHIEKHQAQRKKNDEFNLSGFLNIL